jgi:hypothetical protein
MEKQRKPDVPMVWVFTLCLPDCVAKFGGIFNEPKAVEANHLWMWSQQLALVRRRRHYLEAVIPEYESRSKYMRTKAMNRKPTSSALQQGFRWR